MSNSPEAASAHSNSPQRDASAVEDEEATTSAQAPEEETEEGAGTATSSAEVLEQATQPDIGGFDGAADEPTGVPEAEARISAKKDATLREFLGKMDDYAPIIPDAVTNHYLTLAGLPPPPQTPPHLARLLALATQKFVADIAADAYQYARIRTSHTTSNTAAANPLGNVPGAPAGAGGIPGAAGAAAGGAQGQAGDKSGGKGAPLLGVQRSGYGGGGQGGAGQGRTVLTMEDLGMAVGDYGVNVKRGEFYR